MRVIVANYRYFIAGGPEKYMFKFMEAARKHGIEDIRLYGGPQKNKVDNKIKKDANRIIVNNKNVDIFVIATSDCDFIEVIENLRMHGKRVVVVGSKQAPASLRQSCNKFIEV